MQNLFIEFLPPWVETGLQPAFYDKESGTILQQVSRMYAKMNQIIKSVNDLNKYTHDTIEEYIAKFVELTEYVDNYFDNLDIQTEVDNKLDEMYEDGQLADMVAQYLQLAGVLAYDTIADMAGAENLVAGSIARVLGNSSYATGDGAFYRVRALINTDVVDGVNLVALTEAPTLVAERIPDGNLNSAVTTLNGRIDDIVNEKVLMIGDSYGVGTTYGGETVGWCDRVKTMMGLADADYTKLVEGGSGFRGTGLAGHTFLTLLQANIDNITNKDKYKKIIVCGGCNDVWYTSEQINEYIFAFVTYCKAQFPNAKIYVGMIGNFGGFATTDATNRSNLNKYVVRAYQNIMALGGLYLNGVEYIMHDYKSFMSDDNTHPNDLGYHWVASGIYNAIETGATTYRSEMEGSIINFSNVQDTTFNIDNRVCDGATEFNMPSYCQVTFTSPQTIGAKYNLGDIKFSAYRPNNDPVCIPISYYLQTNANPITYFGGRGMLVLNNDGTITLEGDILKNDGSAYLEVQNVTGIGFMQTSFTALTAQC